jgi:diaminopimelate decarboxylase
LHDPSHPDLFGLAAGQPGPFYLYDTARLRRSCRAFRALPWEPLSVCFATMANAHPTFLAVTCEEGLGVFVNTVGHLERALLAGFDAARVVFTASAMDDAAMARVQALGAEVNLDSTGQVARWRALFPGAPFGLRCNVGERVEARQTRAGWFVGPESRLGLTDAELSGLAGAHDVVSLHLYAGTDILDLGYLADCYRALVRLVPLFPGLTTLDFGGGFGVAGPGERPFDLVAYGALVADVMAEASALAGRRLRLVLEPGRIVGAEAGVFVCRVTDVKRRGERQLVGVDASSAQFPRPLFYGEEARHPIALLPGDGRALDGAVPTQVFGCSTYSRDFLAHRALLPRAVPGDLLVFGLAGAYCASLHTAFLGFPPAAEIFR